MKFHPEHMGFSSPSLRSTVKQEKPAIGNEKRMELLAAAEVLAEKLYGDIPYHNFNHAQETIEAGYEIIAQCQAVGIAVDSDVIRYALLFHDAGYHEDHEKEGFASKEAYAAHLARKTLSSLGISEEVIKKVEKCIMGTHKDETFDSLEEKIVRAADLVGLAGTYEQFNENTLKLKEETELLSGKKISWEEWQQRVKDIIGFYLTQDIKLTECYKDEEGGSRFHKKTRENLKRFMAE